MMVGQTNKGLVSGKGEKNPGEKLCTNRFFQLTLISFVKIILSLNNKLQISQTNWNRFTHQLMELKGQLIIKHKVKE